MNIKIMGKNFKLHLKNDKFSTKIREELNLYCKGGSNSDSEIINVYIDPEIDMNKIISHRNPANTYYSEKILGYQHPLAKIFMNYDKKEIYIYPEGYSSRSWIEKKMRKFYNVQFNYPHECAGQFFHEIVLMLTVLMQDGYFLLHGSAIADIEGKVTIIGGTGGTGKTSTLLALANENDISFVCDDICFCREDKRVFHNMAYPKIYAYNVLGNTELEKKVIGKKIIDKIQWKIYKKINPARVRRRVNPECLYTIEKNKELILDNYIMLNRYNGNDIKIRNVSVDKVVSGSIAIMKTELGAITNHFYWHKLNSIYNNTDQYIDIDRIFNKWEKSLEKSLCGVNLFVVDIPFNIDNEILKNKMKSIILKKVRSY